MIRPRTLVLAAALPVVLLAGTLGVRLLAHERKGPPKPPPPKLARYLAAAPSARVSGPKAVDLASLKVPCWGCPDADGWSVRFQTDLDLLAPLGDGSANAALWLKDFSRQVGARESEADAAMKRRVDSPDGKSKVLPPDDPLLREAEPWADQATMRFYPDVFAVEGFGTRIPNLLVALTLSRSWAARAAAHPDAPEALEDCRRAIRWGRLLRQEDATLIQDLIGLAAVRAGAQELYDLARRRGDQPLMLASAQVLGEHAPQRLKSAELVTRVSVMEWSGETRFAASDERVADVIGVARDAKDRRFRGEAITQLAIVRVRGSRAQREKAEKALDEIQKAKDPVLSVLARWALTATLANGDLAGDTGS